MLEYARGRARERETRKLERQRLDKVMFSGLTFRSNTIKGREERNEPRSAGRRRREGEQIECDTDRRGSTLRWDMLDLGN